MERTLNRQRAEVPLIVGPIAICLAMLGCATVIDGIGGPSPWLLVVDYILAACVVCGTAICVWAFVEVVRLAKVKAEKPLETIWRMLKPKLPYIVLPALVMPIFLAGFTASKTGISHVVGFRFDILFAEVDAAIFGNDPWRYTHAWIGGIGTVWIEILYSPVWIAALGYSKAFVALYAERRMIATFYTAMMLTWFVGGFCLAYLFSAAGPTFIEFNGMEWRFAELKLSLLQLGGDTFVWGPGYLGGGQVPDQAFSGGGVSAMPSMHLAACSIYVLASRGTRWFIPACLFWIIIFVGSIHSGYHYVIDAPVAALVAFLCWKFSERIFATDEAIGVGTDSGLHGEYSRTFT